MADHESLADQAVRVLGLVSRIGEGLDLKDEHRHVVRNIKREAEHLISNALQAAEGLSYFAQEVHDMGRRAATGEQQ